MNTNLISYLEYYLTLDTEPKYAVMIDGEWGSGKTWFSDNLSTMSSLSELKFFKVSLYGKTSTSQIDDDIYKLLHPILSGKHMMFAGAVAKALIKGTIKLDFDHDGKEDARANIQLPEIKIKDLTEHPQKLILIFDDLERCSLSWNEIFGYINEFVERYGCKVIVIANEKAISPKSEDENGEENKEDLKKYNAYLAAKEKVIGKTLSFKPDFLTAWPQFVNDLKNKLLKLFLEDQKNIVFEVLNLSQCHNLRLLRSSLLDFERLYSCLPESTRSDLSLMQELLKRMIIISIENRLNKLSIDEIASYDSPTLKEDVGKLTKKYNLAISSNPILSFACWNEIISVGFINNNVIKNEIHEYIKSRDAKQDSWITLWHYNSLDDHEFDIAFEETIKNLEQKNYQNEHIVKHIFGIILSLKERKFAEINVDYFFKTCCLAIDHIGSSGGLFALEDLFSSFYIYESWGGLGYYNNKDNNFLSLVKYIEDLRELYEKVRYYDVNNDICQMISNSDMNVHCILTPNNKGVKSYYNKPILHFALVNDYVDAILKCKNIQFIGYAFLSRYKTNTNSLNAIRDERFFLKELIDKLTQRMQYLQHPLHRSKIEVFIAENLKPSLDLIEVYRNPKIE